MTNFVHCRGCGVQIHETAVTCPKCGAPQNIANPGSAKTIQNNIYDLSHGYSAVPWFRRRWLVLLCLISFTPIASLLAFTGDIFYKGKNGEVKIFPKNIKNGLMIATLPWLMYMFNSNSSIGALAAFGLIIVAVILALKK
jgi:uncharacterized membrane protein YvbJ